MGKLFIIHFQPVEKYPPAINFIRYISNQNQNAAVEIHLVTTLTSGSKKAIQVEGIVIHRLGEWREKMSKWNRISLYTQFNIRATWLLLRHKPEKVFYYETLSSGAPYIYKRWFNRRSKLFIHYHEYTTPEEYKSGMALNRGLHFLEKRLYNQTAWISHTNKERMELFMKDMGNKRPAWKYIMPNYPPFSWKNLAESKNNQRDERIGFVYVGALSLATMFVQEFASFICSKSSNCYWDVYSDNFSPDVIEYFDTLNASNIHFKGSIEYDRLPEILTSYHVGVILYKGHLPNYVYNAPNKLFEYLAAGLDVWFPHIMKSCHSYVTVQTYPKVLPIDFNSLSDLELKHTLDKSGYQFKGSTYYCETVFCPLVHQLLHV